jgi:hypothetical protein
MELPIQMAILTSVMELPPTPFQWLLLVKMIWIMEDMKATSILFPKHNNNKELCRSKHYCIMNRYYSDCSVRERNMGLFLADQFTDGEEEYLTTAIFTRQVRSTITT